MRSPRCRAALATHVAAEEKGRFLIDERNATHGVPWRESPEHARDFEQRGDAARVIVGPGAVAHGVVMRAEHDDFISVNGACERDFDVGAGNALNLIVLTGRHAAAPGPLLRDIVCSRMQRVRPKHVAFADVPRQHLHVALQRRSQIEDARSPHAICSFPWRTGIAIGVSASSRL
jgi:hypothetical protein